MSHRHYGIQPWSQGPLFPAVIARIEHYGKDAQVERVEWELTYKSHVGVYCSYDLAEAVAREFIEIDQRNAQYRALEQARRPA